MSFPPSAGAGTGGAYPPRRPRIRLQVLREPESVVNGGVDVARRLRVADPIEGVAAAGIPYQLLGPVGDERAMVDLAKISRARLELEIKIFEGQRAVLDHDLIHQPFAPGLVVFVEERRGEPIARAHDLLKPQIERDRHITLREGLEIGGVVGAADLGREAALGSGYLEPGTGAREELRNGEPGVGAIVVEQQHRLRGFRGSRQDVPGGRYEIVAGLQEG